MPRVTRKKKSTTFEDTEYKVEKILDRREDGEVFYKVKWFGFPASHNSWEPASELIKNCKASIEKFELANKQQGEERGEKWKKFWE